MIGAPPDDGTLSPKIRLCSDTTTVENWTLFRRPTLLLLLLLLLAVADGAVSDDDDDDDDLPPALLLLLLMMMSLLPLPILTSFSDNDEIDEFVFVVNVETVVAVPFDPDESPNGDKDRCLLRAVGVVFPTATLITSPVSASPKLFLAGTGGGWGDL